MQLATVIEAEALDALRAMPPDSFTAVIADPPYGLSEPPPARDVLEQWLASGDYRWPRAGGGFMGARWDRFVPGPVLWAEVFRVLRPGGIALVFAAARTDDWMAMSMRLAGFEKIDGIPWLNGQGFPKVSDMGKLIDRQRHDKAEILRCTKWIRERCAELGLKARDLDAACGTAGMGGHWTSSGSQPYVPTRQQWAKLEPLLGPMPPEMEAQRLIIDAREPGEAFKRREVIGVRRTAQPREGVSTDFFGKGGGEIVDSLPATDEAARWSGWASLLKPGNEPVLVMRKPVRGTLVANVILHGCGALHVDACRLPVDDADPVNTATRVVSESAFREGTTGFVSSGEEGERRSVKPPAGGRWPANVLLTHSPDCDDDACVEWCPVAMLDEQSGERRSGARAAGVRAGLGYGGADGDGGPAIEASIGGASRFFWCGRHARPQDLDGFKYAGKARRGDRDAGLPPDIRNRHSTVKPIEVDRWLARLVGEEKGLILVPFAGSGTEARACVLEGFAVVAIEREVEFAELTRLRCGLPETEASGWIRLRDRLRDAAVPRKRAGKPKAKPIRPKTPEVPEVKAWGPEGRAAAAAWLDLTGGDARIVPPPAHMSRWVGSYTPPDDHPVRLPGKLHAAIVTVDLDPGAGSRDQVVADAVAAAVEAGAVATLRGDVVRDAVAEALIEHLEVEEAPADLEAEALAAIPDALIAAGEAVEVFPIGEPADLGDVVVQRHTPVPADFGAVEAAAEALADAFVAEASRPLPYEVEGFGVEAEQDASAEGPTTIAVRAPGRPKRQRSAPEGFRESAAAAVADGDASGPDGASLREDGPARLAQLISGAAGFAGGPEADLEVSPVVELALKQLEGDSPATLRAVFAVASPALVAAAPASMLAAAGVERQTASKVQDRRIPPRRVFRNLDMKRTVWKNLTNWDPAERRLYVDRLFYRHTGKKSLPTRLIIIVDQSGSMTSAMVQTTILASIFAALPRVIVHLVAFDTRVIDLTPWVHDPVEALLRTKLGGGNDMRLALDLAAPFIDSPQHTAVVIISDFYDGSDFFSVLRQWKESGVHLIPVGSLHTTGYFSVSADYREKFKELGAPILHGSPKKLIEQIKKVM